MLLFGAYMGFSISLILVFDSNVILEYTRYSHDNTAHLYIPDTVINNGETSKLANLGTVWLPLYHLILTSLVRFNLLYSTGLAGSIFNAFFSATTAVIIYLLLRGKLGFIAGILYGLNMYTMVHSASSYMVPIGQYLSLAGIYYFTKYYREDSVRALTKTSLFLLLATLARYEAWIPTVMIFTLVVIRELRKKRPWNITYILPSLFGIFSWILYNYIIFGNPLEFVTHKSVGAAGYYTIIIQKIFSPITIDFGGILNDILTLIGPLVVFLPIGFIMYLKKRDFIELLVLASPLILLLSEGKELLIWDHPLYYYYLLPFLYIIGFRGVRLSINYFNRQDIKLLFVFLLILLASLHQLKMYQSLSIELEKASIPYYIERQTASTISIQLKKSPGYILSSSTFYSPRLSVLGGIPAKYILDEYDMPLLLKCSQNPKENNVSIIIIPKYDLYNDITEYIIFMTGKENYIIQYYTNPEWREKFIQNYEEYYSNNQLIVYKIKD